MQDDPLKALNLRVVIILGCLRQTTVRGFAGCGRSRRRDMHLIPGMADEIVRNLMMSIRFERDGVVVIRCRVARHVAEVLQEVSVADARAWAGVDATGRETSRQKIATDIAHRLSATYEIAMLRNPVIVRATNVWCGLREAQDE